MNITPEQTDITAASVEAVAQETIAFNFMEDFAEDGILHLTFFTVRGEGGTEAGPIVQIGPFSQDSGGVAWVPEESMQVEDGRFVDCVEVRPVTYDGRVTTEFTNCFDLADVREALAKYAPLDPRV